MEQLDELEGLSVAIVKEEDTDTAGSAEPSHGCIVPPPVTPSKRKRQSSIAHPLNSLCVKEEPDAADESPPALKRARSHRSLSLVDEESCFGCARTKESGRCFVDGTSPVHWSDPRSRWCNDCHNCWWTHLAVLPHAAAIRAVACRPEEYGCLA